MKRPCYVVDAFAAHPLAGNSAGVVLDAADLSTAELQGIAEELKHAETAFPLPPREARTAFHLRWFTTFCEVGFCGHATLAALHVLAEETQRIRIDPEGVTRVSFTCKAGSLRAELSRSEGKLRASFETPPARFAPQMVEPAVLAALNLVPEVLDPRIPPHRSVSEEGNLYLCVRDRDVLGRVRADAGTLPSIAQRLGVIGFVPFTLAPGPGSDVAVRAIFADHGVAEDPATGSASAQLALLV
ncbi:MAG TPA: PhzF family phenazine biosynthesis protein, partial [Myxococcales bacterium]|nr:PhzF family phenazine biosynthesis protein [Myxococcales bacterium]